MTALVSTGKARDPIAVARMQSLLRFSTGVTVAFIVCEAMGWLPTFLAPVLVATLLASLPSAPPLKVGIALVAVMAAASLVAFALASLLRGSPEVLVGALALVIFLAFVILAQGRAKLPATLLLICVSTIPVVVMIAPAMAGALPLAMVRAMAVAILVIWCVYALWPKVVPQVAPPAPVAVESPVMTALVGTAVVMPVMLVYLLLGMTDALPVLVTTVMLVTNFDPQQGAMHGLAMMLGNLGGGLLALAAFMLLAVAPSLITLALVTFLIATGFAVRIDQGGPRAAIALITCNSFLIMLSIALATPSSSSGLWLSRLTQFGLACVFTIGMMNLVWRRKPQPER